MSSSCSRCRDAARSPPATGRCCAPNSAPISTSRRAPGGAPSGRDPGAAKMSRGRASIWRGRGASPPSRPRGRFGPASLAARRTSIPPAARRADVGLAAGVGTAAGAATDGPKASSGLGGRGGSARGARCAGAGFRWTDVGSTTTGEAEAAGPAADDSAARRARSESSARAIFWQTADMDACWRVTCFSAYRKRSRLVSALNVPHIVASRSRNAF
mmetsp:Transcript_5563/g.18478  ORF Transcript_5563/g.18478 Transcript_5563/m.18478 type:complete len:215 (+) Transcript_5563:1079-1723(+)|eukprot:scaffold29750_cov112-Isochrysis_galbana.AAC.3